MTHDPLCPYEPERRTPCTHGLDENGFATIESITTDMCQGERHYWPGVPCDCDLIAKVRADERNRCIAEIEALGPLQQFRTWIAEDGYPMVDYEAVDVAEALRREPSWKLTHLIATGPVRRITP